MIQTIDPRRVIAGWKIHGTPILAPRLRLLVRRPPSGAGSIVERPVKASIAIEYLGIDRFTEQIYNQFITLRFLIPAILGAAAVAVLMSFGKFNTTLFLVGSVTTLPINLYLQVRDGSPPVINAISLVLILGTSMAALANLYFSRKEEGA